MADVLITRPLPEMVLTKARAGLNVTVRDSNAPMTRDEMVAALGAYDAIVPTLGDNFSAGVLGAARPLRCRLLANFGVGYNHIDVTAAAALGIAVTNTPGAVTSPMTKKSLVCLGGITTTSPSSRNGLVSRTPPCLRGLRSIFSTSPSGSMGVLGFRITKSAATAILVLLFLRRCR